MTNERPSKNDAEMAELETKAIKMEHRAREAEAMLRMVEAQHRTKKLKAEYAVPPPTSKK